LTLLQEPQSGSLAAKFSAAFQESGIGTTDATPFLSNLFVKKDEQELKLISSGCEVSHAVAINFLFTKLRQFKDEKIEKTHAQVSELASSLYVNCTEISDKLDAKFVDAAYAPIVRSGVVKEFAMMERPSNATINYQVVTVEVGTRLMNYCSEVGRTFFSNATEQMRDDYDFLVRLFAHLQAQLKRNAKLSDVYNSGIEFTKGLRPKLVHHLTPTFGYSIGIELHDRRFMISKEISRYVAEGHTYTLRVGLVNLRDGDKEYGMLLSDTLVITAIGNKNLTAERAEHSFEFNNMDAVVAAERVINISEKERRKQEPDQ
jgi:nucleosome binding factor SPN SPT16 subunit